MSDYRKNQMMSVLCIRSELTHSHVRLMISVLPRFHHTNGLSFPRIVELIIFQRLSILFHSAHNK